jgi:putative transposase
MQTSLATPGYAALRRGRRSLETQTYLVTTTTSARTPLFADFDRASLAAAVLSERHLWRDSTLLCWVLMPDHWHGIVELGHAESLADVMRRVKAVTSAAINRYERRVGSIWASGYHDHALRYEEDLVGIARYVVANPIRAGICARVGEYPFWDAAWL